MAHDPDHFRIESVKEEDYEKYIRFMMDHFFPRAPVTRGLHTNITQIEKHFRKQARVWVSSGASVCAVFTPTQELAGITFAQILTRNDKQIFVQDQIEEDDQSVKNWFRVAGYIEAQMNFFDDPKIETILEIATTAVHPKFAGNRITYRLGEECEKLGVQLGCQIAISQSTNKITQHVRQKTGYESVYTLDYDKFELDGEKVFDLSVMGGTTSMHVFRKDLIVQEV